MAVLDADTFPSTVKQNRGRNDGSMYRGVTTRQSAKGVKKWIAQQRIPKTATADARTEYIGIFDSETEAGSAWTAWVRRRGNLHLFAEEAVAGRPAADQKENEEPFHVEGQRMQGKVYGKKSNQQQTQMSAVENRPPENVRCAFDSGFVCLRLSLSFFVMELLHPWVCRLKSVNDGTVCAGTRSRSRACEGPARATQPEGC